MFSIAVVLVKVVDDSLDLNDGVVVVEIFPEIYVAIKKHLLV